MLISTDDRVRASINLHAVLAALPTLAQLAPEAREALSGLAKPVTLTLRAPGGLTAQYTFTRDGIRSGGGASGPTLLFRSAAHLNAVIDGTAQPVPLAGPAGITFLTKVFTPLSAILGDYLQPSPEALHDPVHAERSTLLTLEVVASAVAIVANEDPSGQISAAHMADGDIDFEVGEERRYRLRVHDHRVERIAEPSGSPRAALRFHDLQTAGDVLGGRVSALACVSDGRIAMRGYIPLVDNVNRILDRVGAYLGA